MKFRIACVLAILMVAVANAYDAVMTWLDGQKQ